jgi:hypothetical protein
VAERYWLFRYSSRYDDRYTLITHPTEPDMAVLAAWAEQALGYVPDWADEVLGLIELEPCTMAAIAAVLAPH